MFSSFSFHLSEEQLDWIELGWVLCIEQDMHFESLSSPQDHWMMMDRRVVHED